LKVKYFFKETDLSRRSPTLLIWQGNKICLLAGVLTNFALFTTLFVCFYILKFKYVFKSKTQRTAAEGCASRC